jgi:hypothetical protein
MRVTRPVILQDHGFGGTGIAIAQVGFEAALPVAVSQRGGAAREHQLTRHVEIVRHGVGREM